MIEYLQKSPVSLGVEGVVSLARSVRRFWLRAQTVRLTLLVGVTAPPEGNHCRIKQRPKR